MTLRSLWLLGVLALALASTGCGGGGRKNPPDTTVRVLNVAPSFPQLTYRREQVTASNPPTALSYQGTAQAATSSTDFLYDEDTYHFTASSPDPANPAADVDRDTFTQKIVNGTRYTFVFLESAGTVTHMILESPLAPTDTAKALVTASHATETAPRVDLYLEPSGTDISGATPWGTIGFKESLAPREVAAGNYELTVTEAGNRANVLLKTQEFGLNAPFSTTLVLSPDAGEGIAPFDVVLLDAMGTITLVDPSLPAHVRSLNGATDQMPRDVAFNSEFSPPLFSAVAFGQPTAYQSIAAAASVPFNVTPVGNPGVLELTSTVALVSSRTYTTFFTGDAGALSLNYSPDDRRRYVGLARITFYGAHTVAVPEVLVLDPSTDPTTAPSQPNPLFIAPATVNPTTLLPGTYDLWLRTFGTSTIVGGPVTITVAEKGLYGIVTSNDADGTTIDMKSFDDSL